MNSDLTQLAILRNTASFCEESGVGHGNLRYGRPSVLPHPPHPEAEEHWRARNHCRGLCVADQKGIPSNVEDTIKFY